MCWEIRWTNCSGRNLKIHVYVRKHVHVGIGACVCVTHRWLKVRVEEIA